MRIELNNGARWSNAAPRDLASINAWARPDVKTPGKFWLWKKQLKDPKSDAARWYRRNNGIVTCDQLMPEFVFRHVGFAYEEV